MEEKTIIGVVELKDKYEQLLNQIEDYLCERVSADDSPRYVDGLNERYERIRECVAILMAGATDEIKRQVWEEMCIPSK